MNANGFTGNEIVTRVRNFVGDQSTNLKVYIEQSLDMAQFRFCKAHSWSFLERSNISLAIDGTLGVNEYNLVAIVDPVWGYNVSVLSKNINMISIKDPGIVLRKISLNDMRRFDPEQDNGSATESVTMWCPISDTKIKFWPDKFEAATLVIDASVLPSYWFQDLTRNPIIPYRYQESFINYVIALALKYVDDGRAEAFKAEALEDIKGDIRDDIEQRSDVDLPRFRSMQEARLDGAGASLDALLFGFLQPYD